MGNAFTIKGWVYPEDDTATKTVVSRWGVVDSFAVYIDADLVTFNTGGLSDNGISGTAGKVPKDVWTQIAVTYSEVVGDKILYVNGKEDVKETGITGSVTADADDLWMGKLQVGTERYFNGGIALLQITKRAWSALEVQSNFNREKHLFGVW